MRTRLAIPGLALLSLALAVAAWPGGEAPRPPGDDARRDAVDAIAANERGAAPLAGAEPPTSAPGSLPSGAESSGTRTEWTAADAPAAIAGCVLDGVGAPIAGTRVRLHTVGLARSVGSATTDEAGRFSFGALAAGRCQLRLLDHWLEDAHDLEVQPGEAREVALQTKDRTVLLWGQLRRAGEPVQGRKVELAGTHVVDGGLLVVEDLSIRTDREGLYRFLVPPGDYELIVHGDAWRRIGPGGTQLPCVSVPVELVRPPARVRVDLELTATDVQVHVVSAADGEPVSNATVHAARDDLVVSEQVGGSGGRRLRDLPFGSWILSVTAPGFVDSPPQRIVLENGAGPVACTFVLARGGSAVVRLLDAAGRPLVVPPSNRLVPTLHGENGALVATSSLAMGSYRFAGVPPGTYELRCDDSPPDRPDGSIAFVPWDPFAPRQVSIVAGAEATIEIGVARRALVMVRHADRSEGAEVVDMRSGSRVHALIGMHPWCAFLPPGDYEVTWKRPTGPVRRRIAVQREDLVVAPDR